MIDKLIEFCKGIKDTERTVLFLSTNIYNNLKKHVEDNIKKFDANSKTYCCNIEIREGIHLEDSRIAEATYFNGEIKSLKVHNLNK